MRAAPRRILVLCMGNICRSPYAAGVLARELPGREVRSAGFLEAGRGSPRFATSVAAERGINLTTHRSVRVTQELVDWADLILVMDRGQARRARNLLLTGCTPLVELLGDFDTEPVDTRTVLDPNERARAVFNTVYERIDRCCAVIAGSVDRA